MPSPSGAILVMLPITEIGDTHVRLFSSYGVHTVTSALSQINCNIVSVTKEVRYKLIVTKEITFTIDSSLTCLGHERV